MDNKINTHTSLAAAITRTASKQTYYTIRLFVDRDRVDDAYRAYGYFRWVDDMLDDWAGSQDSRLAFGIRQQVLLEGLIAGKTPQDLCAEEKMLAELVRNDPGEDARLRSYLHNMMAVMLFDSQRRGRLISQSELNEYTRTLATAVTDAMYYFIGHDDPTPVNEARYLSVSAAHITHMLRDMLEDNEAGYFNIPKEYLQEHMISPGAVGKPAYREWVYKRVRLARMYFDQGSRYLSQVKSLRCRLAGFAYTARFEWMLRAIERDNYNLRPAYPERKNLSTGVWMGWKTLASLLSPACVKNRPRTLPGQSIQVKES